MSLETAENLSASNSTHLTAQLFETIYIITSFFLILDLVPDENVSYFITVLVHIPVMGVTKHAV